MAKYDAVDRLMKMATDKTPSGTAAGRGEERDGEAVLEAKVAARERMPSGGVAMPAPPPAPTEPEISSVERGRQLLGALRPFLPAVGSALRLVDHGAVQAVARMLPMLGNLGVDAAPSSAPASSPGNSEHAAEALAASEKQYAALNRELDTYKARLGTMEEGQRRLRELLERSAAEQGTLTHTLHQLADRSRLLSAVVIILVMLVVAEMVLLAITLHR